LWTDHGPIPVATADPELSKWLDGSKGGVVYVSLGTLFNYTDDYARNMLQGLVQGLPACARVLWKLNGKFRFEAIIDEVLKEEKDPGRFRLVEWMEADPAGVLEHPNVVCSVHHGGANSLFETFRYALSSRGLLALY
jgi:UDP:flavonoid glycosyltransferase YjiC (YdhE family)